MNKDLRKVVILLAHPNMKESQANKALIDAVSDIEGVAVFNLYDQQGASFDVDEWSKIISVLPPSFINFPFIGWLRRHCSKNGRTKYSPSFPRLRQ